MTEPTNLDDSQFAHTSDDCPSGLEAELYLGGDLSPEFEEAFEAALDDPDYLEQLVKAVEVRDALTGSSACKLVMPRFSRFGARQVAAVAASVAALCLVVGLLVQGSGDQDTVASNNDEATPRVGQVAAGSAITADSLAPVWVEFSEDSVDDSETIVGLSLAGVSVEDANVETDVPDWLYAAVALPADEDEIILPGDTL